MPYLNDILSERLKRLLESRVTGMVLFKLREREQGNGYKGTLSTTRPFFPNHPVSEKETRAARHRHVPIAMDPKSE
jgi:hypothetical protein